VKVEWKRGNDFAEYAEALGIRVDQVFALKAGGDEPTVIVYTPESDPNDLDPHTPLVVAMLGRDGESILRIVGEPRLMDIDWNDIETAIETKLREEFGEPGS
jgi:hypothetical protein